LQELAEPVVEKAQKMEEISKDMGKILTQFRI
jgi:hypothetical protein